MAAAGINSIRTYVPPPAWLLDAALDARHPASWSASPGSSTSPSSTTPTRAQRIAARLGDEVRACERPPGDPLLLDRQRDPGPDRALARQAAGRALPRAPPLGGEGGRPRGRSSPTSTTPRPSTWSCPSSTSPAFNVFLEQEGAFEAYLARLQNLSGDRPLLITELGLDSRRNGDEAQARALEWQVRHAFATGAAGTFVFAWTDEWHRGGHEVLDWDFGLVDRERAAEAGAGGGQRAPTRRSRSRRAGPGRRSRSSSAPTTAQRDPRRVPGPPGRR